MIATTSIPAIWAISGTAIIMVFLFVYMLVIFMVFAAIFWPLVYFAKMLYKFMFNHRYYD